MLPKELLVCNNISSGTILFLDDLFLSKSAPEDLVQCSAPQRGGTAVISSNYSFVQYSTCNIGVRLCNHICYKTGSSKIGILTLIQVQPIFLPSLYPSLHKGSHPVKKNTAFGQHSALLSVSISWLLAIP